jgi:hypothetical protein
MRKHIVLVCLTALAVAGAVPAVGAVSHLINGNNIKNRSISGSKIKKRTLTLNLLSKKTIAALRGSATVGGGGNVAGAPGENGAVGPTGPTGPKGDKGDPGANGPSGTTLITPSNLQGFTAVHSTGCLNSGETSTGSQSFNGAYQFEVGTQGNSYEKISKPYNVPLTDLTSLTYDTLVQHDGSGGQAPFIVVNVDPDGNPATDNTEGVFFEPVYADGTYSYDPSGDKAKVAPQPALKTHAWQTWDVRNGGLELNGGGPPLFTLDRYEANNPNARIVSIGVSAGCGSGAWDNFVGNVRHLSIGIGPNVTDYLFQG